MPIEPSQVLDNKYRVVRRIGEGGMGTVYEGLNVRIDRRVAIKVLHEQVAAMPEIAERFEREARAAARIGSPYVCDVLDLGDLENGERYIVMEFLDGMSLEERIDAGTMTADDLAPIAFEVLEGLGTMHHAGIVHRDLKPANVFLARTGNRRKEMVKILDFGIAKILPRADDPAQMTSTGMMMGTPLYMSPEQARGARDVDGRSDLYSASVILYRALTGTLPYSAENLNELLFKIVLEPPRPLRDARPEVDEAFAEIVMKGLSRERDARFATAREYQEAIAAWGRARGRSSLTFTVSLPSGPPPAPAPSASADAERPGQASTTAMPPATPVAVSAKAEASTLESGATLRAAEAARPSGGTPVAWSGGAKRESSQTAASSVQAASAPRTERVAPREVASPAAPPSARPVAAAVRPTTKHYFGIGAAAVLVFGLAAARARLGAEAAPSPAPSAEAVAEPPVGAPAAEPTTISRETPASIATPAASEAPPEQPPEPHAVRGAVAPHPPTRKEPHRLPVPAVSTANVAATAAATPPASASAPAGRRKFRTNLD